MELAIQSNFSPISSPLSLLAPWSLPHGPGPTPGLSSWDLGLARVLNILLRAEAAAANCPIKNILGNSRIPSEHTWIRLIGCECVLLCICNGQFIMTRVCDVCYITSVTRVTQCHATSSSSPSQLFRDNVFMRTLKVSSDTWYLCCAPADLYIFWLRAG